jgi:hypothetical protein
MRRKHGIHIAATAGAASAKKLILSVIKMAEGLFL